jgi:hypothetical protein
MTSAILLKRSSTQGKVPLTSDLQLGEIALNTYDGKAYFKKDNGTTSVAEILTTSSGVVSTSQLGSGTADSTTYLRGDNTWATVTSGATITDDTSSSATYYPSLAVATSGAMTTAKVSSTKLTFHPDTGTLSATIFSGSGASLTNLNASNISSGTVGAGYLGTGTADNTTYLRGDNTWASISGSTLTNLNASNLSSGTVSTARLGTGTADSTTYLRGDNTWATISKSTVGLSNVEDTALSTWAGSTNITTIGTATATSLIVTGDLTVNGTNTIINSTTISVDDKNIELGSVATPTNVTANGGGITLKGTTDKTIIWDSTNSNWTSSENWNLATGKVYKINNTTIASETAFGALSGENLTSLNASNLSSGTVSTARLGTGTADNTTYLRGDNTWQTISAAISAVDNQTNASYYPIFATSQGASVTLGTDVGYLYNPNTGLLSVANLTVTNTITGSVSGNAATATTANATNTANNFQMNSLGVGTAGSGTAGEIRATNNVTAYYTSDRSLKENDVVIENALEKVSAIRGVTFDWTDAEIAARGGEDGYFVRKHDVGVIAQEIEAVLPEAVATRENGIKAVRYDLIVPLLIEAIKELSTEVDLLKNKE